MKLLPTGLYTVCFRQTFLVLLSTENFAGEVGSQIERASVFLAGFTPPQHHLRPPAEMRRPWPHLRGEHGDVVELSTPPLLDRDGQEEAAAVFGEHRLLVLQHTQISVDVCSHSFMFKAVFTELAEFYFMEM